MHLPLPADLLSPGFYSNPDVVDVSRKLLGKVLCSTIGGTFTSGIIIETEAYSGRNDKACHAYNGLRTKKTEVMYGDPGHAYIYLCYGMHHLFNVVTNVNGLADAVLIRAIYPLEGKQEIVNRRNIKSEKNLTDGPGKLTQALGITVDLTGCSLFEPPVWIEDRNLRVNPKRIEETPRIGVDYAGKDAQKLWRFTINPTHFVSK
ncbi:MAG: DNA-3-methyladenine glycosylase [Balneolaceae bacterium]|nr:MAG: DNA-3-methyladenine glycosylase [Balneolaceae bacterium]